MTSKLESCATKSKQIMYIKWEKSSSVFHEKQNRAKEKKTFRLRKCTEGLWLELEVIILIIIIIGKFSPVMSCHVNTDMKCLSNQTLILHYHYYDYYYSHSIVLPLPSLIWDDRQKKMRIHFLHNLLFHTLNLCKLAIRPGAECKFIKCN